jgi:hypothetical protein
VRPRHEGGHRVFSFAIYLRGGHALPATFPTQPEADAARMAVVDEMTPRA